MLRIIFLLFITISLQGQTIDTTQVFSLDKYLGYVRSYHPVMQQANLLDSEASAQILEARGALDPKWFGDYEDKSFDQKNYFRVGQAGLKVPLWWGADVKLAYSWSSGSFINPAETLPQNGQAVLGLDLPLLQGLIFDQRRSQVQQARIFREANKANRANIINNLFLEAIKAYWEWAFHYQRVNIYEESLSLAEDRFENIRESFFQGDKPAIDTLESMIQVQNRVLQLNQAQLELQEAMLSLSNYLWYEDLVPLEISNQLRPQDLTSDWRPESMPSFQSIRVNHPEIQALTFKLKQLDIKEKWKREQFKPQLNFNYNLLGNGFNLLANTENPSEFNNFFFENYKWGLRFSYPLLLRKERGGLQLVKLEQLETNYKLRDKQLQIENKLKNILQALNNTNEQLILQGSVVRNYRTLLTAENEKFRIGESSIFLLNSREQKLIESQLKLNKLKVNYQKLRWKFDWVKGILK